jgi:hypothetical protein
LLKVNVSRLRKTFVNRVFEILDGDLIATAQASGSTVAVTDSLYLRPSEDSRKNWRFMGVVLVNELLTNTIGATERTPMGRCSDPRNGEFAPKRPGAVCMSFMNCLRCRNYVVTGDDLYRLFSFYWRILQERARLGRRAWKRRYSHIVRTIDRDVVAVGLNKGVLKRLDVERQRARARLDPHPFWKSASIVEDVESLEGFAHGT